MILWISSYPKSGNTWIRSLISTYLYSDKGEFKFDLLFNIPKFIQEKYIAPVIELDKLIKNPLKISEYWESAQLRINLEPGIKFFKTHNACVAHNNKWFTDERNTIGYIYIVRDPRAVACSLAYHSNASIETSVNDILNDNQVGYNGPHKLAEISSSWKINYLSWKKKKKFDGILIKYEDLIDDTEKEFTKIIKYLKNIMNIEINEKKISKCLDSCKFSKLREMEDMYGFSEATNNKFFRIGSKDSWKNELSDNLRRKIEANLKDEMFELGYL